MLDGNAAAELNYQHEQDVLNAGFNQSDHDKEVKELAKDMAEECILDISDDMTIDALIDLSAEFRDVATHELPQSADEMSVKDFQNFGRDAHALFWKLQQKLIENNLTFAAEELS